MPKNTSITPVKTSAFILIGMSLLSIFFMAHHPTLGAPGHETLAHEATAEAGLNGFVHGSLIVLTIGYFVCLLTFVQQLGRLSLLVNAGLVSFATATMTMTVAALVSGFIVPEAASSLIRAGAASDFDVQLRVLGAFNKTFANAGTIAYGVAIVLWSSRLVMLSGVSKIVGGLGLPLGAAIAGGIVTGALTLTVSGMTLVVVGLALWFISLSLLMIAGRLSVD